MKSRTLFILMWTITLALSIFLYNTDSVMDDFANSLGILIEKSGDVQYRQEDSGLWLSARSGQEFADGNIVSTGQKSTASVYFQGKQVMSLGADSQIILTLNAVLNSENKSSSFLVNVLKGSLKIKIDTKNSDVRELFQDKGLFSALNKPAFLRSKAENSARQPIVKAGTQSIQLSDEKMELEIDKIPGEENARVKMIAGKATVKNETTGKSSDLEMGKETEKLEENESEVEAVTAEKWEPKLADESAKSVVLWPSTIVSKTKLSSFRVALKNIQTIQLAKKGDKFRALVNVEGSAADAAKNVPIVTELIADDKGNIEVPIFLNSWPFGDKKTGDLKFKIDIIESSDPEKKIYSLKDSVLLSVKKMDNLAGRAALVLGLGEFNKNQRNMTSEIVKNLNSDTPFYIVDFGDLELFRKSRDFLMQFSKISILEPSVFENKNTLMAIQGHKLVIKIAHSNIKSSKVWSKNLLPLLKLVKMSGIFSAEEKGIQDLAKILKNPGLKNAGYISVWDGAKMQKISTDLLARQPGLAKFLRAEYSLGSLNSKYESFDSIQNNDVLE